MALGALLETLGVGGSIATAVSAAIALYHGRSVLAFAARLGTWLRIAGLVGFVLFLALLGLIPGVDLAVQFGVLADLVGGLVEAVPVPPLSEVLP
ncbi:hypothetical protein [Halobellus ordinarius]|uniref:hypothetical protein n=1 Tax=Halobellus ordinarius TaxID=3075120 RepID=UPI0028804F35|nr:hypothetical protein [Halobellus sp. ZY16]